MRVGDKRRPAAVRRRIERRRGGGGFGAYLGDVKAQISLGRRHERRPLVGLDFKAPECHGVAREVSCRRRRRRRKMAKARPRKASDDEDWSRCPVLPTCKRRHSSRTCARGTTPVARASPTGKMAALRAVTGAIAAARTLRARPAMATRVARVGARPPASLDSTSAGSLGRVIARPLPGPIRPLAASPRARRSLSTIPSAGHHPDAIPSGISDPHSFEVRLPIPPPRWAPIHSVARATQGVVFEKIRVSRVIHRHPRRVHHPNVRVESRGRRRALLRGDGGVRVRPHERARVRVLHRVLITVSAR